MILVKPELQRHTSCFFLPEGKTAVVLQKRLLFSFLALFILANYGNTQNKWTKQNSDVSEALTSVIWGNNQFVAVSDDSLIITSADGITWTRHSVNARLFNIIWTGQHYIAVGDTVVISHDGITWTYGKLPSLPWGHTMYTVIWDGKQFVGAGTYIFRSFDGISWDIVLSLPKPNYGLDFIWTGEQYVALYDFEYMYTSSDLNTWDTVPRENVPGCLRSFTWDGKRIVGIADSKVYKSKDAYTWTLIDTLPYDGRSKSLSHPIRYLGNTYIYCGGLYCIYISHISQPWRKITFDEENVVISDVAFSGDIFVAVGASSSGGAVYTSALVTSVQPQTSEAKESNTIMLRQTRSALNLTLPHSFINQPVTLQLHTMSGRRFFSRKLYANKLTYVCTLDNFRSGRYIVSVRSNTISLSKCFNFIQ